MAMSNKEKQAAYRERQRIKRINGDEKQINTWISGGAYYALKNLALNHGVTKREMLELLIAHASYAVTRNVAAGKKEVTIEELLRNQYIDLKAVPRRGKKRSTKKKNGYVAPTKEHEVPQENEEIRS